MSWYTLVFIGIMDKNNKIKPWGPYDASGNLRPIFCHSRSFTSDLKDAFYRIEKENLTDELCKAFPYETGQDSDSQNQEVYSYFGYLPITELPTGSYIKHGYCKISDINSYESISDKYLSEYFQDALSTVEYLRKLENEIKFGTPKPKIDEDGYEYTEPSCAEYSYYSWPDYNCQEYESYLIREAYEMLEDYHMLDQGYTFVAIKTEG